MTLIFHDYSYLENIIRDISVSYIFQLENTEGSEGKKNLHYQGFIQLSEKSRSSTLGKSLNTKLFGIQFSHCHDSYALKKYCMKEDTRVLGPWSSEHIYVGKDLERIRSSKYDWQ